MRLMSLSLCLFVVANCSAQNRIAARPVQNVAQPVAPMRIALVDMGILFEAHPRHRQKMQAIRDDVARFDSLAKQTQQQLKQLAEKRNALKPTSPDYKEFDRQIAQLSSNLHVQSQMKRKEIIEREAQAYLTTFNEIMVPLKQVCRRHGIVLAIRYNSKPADESSPSSILKRVNRPILHQENIDITQLVRAELK